MKPRVNKWFDLLDRAGWTALQAAAGAGVAALAVDGMTWRIALVSVASATGAAVFKVVLAQQTGNGAGDLVPGKEVIETK